MFVYKILQLEKVNLKQVSASAVSLQMLAIQDKKWFKRFCAHRVEKMALIIYARTMSTVSPERKARFFRRLMRCVKGAKTDKESEDLYYAMEDKILSDHRFFHFKMWNFCGQTAMRLSYQFRNGTILMSEFRKLRRRLFRILRKCADDADINAKAAAFFEKVRGEFARGV